MYHTFNFVPMSYIEYNFVGWRPRISSILILWDGVLHRISSILILWDGVGQLLCIIMNSLHKLQYHASIIFPHAVAVRPRWCWCWEREGVSWVSGGSPQRSSGSMPAERCHRQESSLSQQWNEVRREGGRERGRDSRTLRQLEDKILCTWMSYLLKVQPALYCYFLQWGCSSN